MSKCQCCKREMTKAAGCAFRYWKLNGRWVRRIPVMEYDLVDGRCADCGAKPGNYHHPGCDNERCPVCGLQMIFSCTCEGDELATGIPEE